jgi:homogentisate 1,2-dioxygenase
MLPHGPDADAFRAASAADLKPHKLEGTMAFMFETFLPQLVTHYAANLPERQLDYAECWNGLERMFNPHKR